MEMKICHPTNPGTYDHRKETKYITIKRYYMGRRKGKKDRVCSGIVNHKNFECNMYITEEEEEDFECANLKQ
jgi:hypothetical protein